jgi:hypothetical protein
MWSCSSTSIHFRVSRAKTPRRPHRLWGSSRFLSNGYRGGGSFPGGKAA